MNYYGTIKTLRNKMMLSQVEFVEKLGGSFDIANKWETGKHDPTIKVKRLLSPYLKKYKLEVNL